VITIARWLLLDIDNPWQRVNLWSMLASHIITAAVASALGALAAYKLIQ
jgi:hypothetical protein